MLISSFTPCSARFAVILYIGAAFFSPVTATLVMSGLIVLSWVIKAMLSYVIKTRYGAEESPIQKIELPPSHFPKAAMVVRATVFRTLDFLNRIKNVVIISSVIIWFLSTSP